MANFTLSESERNEIESHARAIARKAAYNGAVEAWHDTATGEVQYVECVGSDYIVSERNTMERVCRVPTPAR